MALSRHFTLLSMLSPCSILIPRLFFSSIVPLQFPVHNFAAVFQLGCPGVYPASKTRFLNKILRQIFGLSARVFTWQLDLDTLLYIA